jgi:hypothetical protein
MNYWSKVLGLTVAGFCGIIAAILAIKIKMSAAIRDYLDIPTGVFRPYDFGPAWVFVVLGIAILVSLLIFEIFRTKSV